MTLAAAVGGLVWAVFTSFPFLLLEFAFSQSELGWWFGTGVYLVWAFGGGWYAKEIWDDPSYGPKPPLFR